MEFLAKKLTVTTILLCLVVTACVTLGGQEVVTRSKEKAPDWASRNEGKLYGENSNIQFLAIKKKQNDLALGIKSTQLAALDGSRKAMNIKVYSELESLASNEKIILSNVTELDTAVRNVVQKKHAEYARVNDIYFEQIKDVDQEENVRDFYDIFVLVNLNQSSLVDIYQDLSAQLRGSNLPDLRQLGAAIKPDNIPQLSH